MRTITLIATSVFISLGCIASESLNQIKDQNVSFVLNKFSILLEYNDPKAFPAISRLILMPDREDTCEWISIDKNIPTAIIEDSCPAKELLLTLTNWDEESEFYAYDLGSALNWSVVSLKVKSKQNMSHWDAQLVLDAQFINDKGLYREKLSFDIKNRGDVYSVEKHSAMPSAPS